jgi:hypothetical protein
MAWGSQTCQSLFKGNDLLKTSESRVPVWGAGGQYTNFLGNLSGCIEGQMSVETNHSVLNLPGADVWWYCREGTLQVTLLSNWSGTCALLQLVIPRTLAFCNSTHSGNHQMSQSERETPSGSFDDSKGTAEQLDATSSRKRWSYVSWLGYRVVFLFQITLPQMEPLLRFYKDCQWTGWEFRG